eukprot:TRINITY_DN6815_c0_g1_i5.p2 TRINITY_DN6815_c0_g1~~TRINITY_DN6815_c0_g1_i5.p2  ORF type:complete len:119 (+),score=33.46 TRINITY_DN6815_c0_g1_i5:1385-1741(+)
MSVANITDRSLEKLKNLTDLDLHQNYSRGITDASVSLLTCLVRLRLEPYRNAMITDRSLSVLVNLRFLNGCPIAENEIPRLALLDGGGGGGGGGSGVLSRARSVGKKDVKKEDLWNFF